MARARAPFLLLPVCLAALGLSGCDPKLTTGAGPADDDNNDVPLQISPEARLAAAVTMLQLDIIESSLAVSGDFDGTPSPFRSFLTDGCITLTTLDAQTPVHELSLNGCVDPNGSQYFGKGELSPLTTGDGYAFLPYVNIEDVIAVGNTENPELQHSWHSGSIQFEFVRDGSNVVTSLNVTNFMRHYMHDSVVTFSFVGMSYTGSPGNHSQWPVGGGIIRVAWDGVGVFDVTYSGGSSATFRLAGIDYRIDLTSGTLSIVQP
jgi:hypothetical protein